MVDCFAFCKWNSFPTDVALVLLLIFLNKERMVGCFPKAPVYRLPLVLCTSEVRPNYLPIFYNISQTMRAFLLFPTFSIASPAKLFLSFCKKSQNLGKEIRSQLWWGGERDNNRGISPKAHIWTFEFLSVSTWYNSMVWWHDGEALEQNLCQDFASDTKLY